MTVALTAPWGRPLYSPQAHKTVTDIQKLSRKHTHTLRNPQTHVFSINYVLIAMTHTGAHAFTNTWRHTHASTSAISCLTVFSLWTNTQPWAIIKYYTLLSTSLFLFPTRSIQLLITILLSPPSFASVLSLSLSLSSSSTSPPDVWLQREVIGSFPCQTN